MVFLKNCKVECEVSGVLNTKKRALFITTFAILSISVNIPSICMLKTLSVLKKGLSLTKTPSCTKLFNSFCVKKRLYSEKKHHKYFDTIFIKSTQKYELTRYDNLDLKEQMLNEERFFEALKKNYYRGIIDLTKKVDINTIKDENGKTPLEIAYDKNNLELAKFFKKYSAKN